MSPASPVLWLQDESCLLQPGGLQRAATLQLVDYDALSIPFSCMQPLESFSSLL